MNPPMSYTTGLTQLALLTSQEANFTFTSDELDQALTNAWNDTYVSVIVWDSSLSFTSGTWQYALPATVTTVRELYYKKTSTDNPERLSPELYEVINGNIQFNPAAERWLISGTTIYIKGLEKLTTDDDLPTVNLINYVIYSAAELLLDRLALKASFVFLRNDISVGDISRVIGIISGKALRYKQALLREFESS